MSIVRTGVHEVEDQELCLYLGREVGINMDSIIVAAVVDVRTSQTSDNVRNQTPSGPNQELCLQIYICTYMYILRKRADLFHLVSSHTKILILSKRNEFFFFLSW